MKLARREVSALGELGKAQAMVHGARVQLSRALASSDLPRALKIKATERAKAIGEAMAQLSKTLEQGKLLALSAGDLIYDADKGRAILEKEDRAGRKKGAPKKGNSRVTIPKAQLVAEGRRAPLASVAPEIERGVRDAFRKHGVPISSAAVAAVAKLEPALAKKAIAKLGDKPEIRRALSEVKIEAKRKLAASIRKNPIVTPDGRYQVIAIDPPWKYATRAEDASHRGRTDYPDMTVEEICALDVAKYAQKDCVLWLWTTNAFMREAFVCLDAWGFEQKTILTWDKVTMGLGDWLRNVTEHCILAVRGKPLVDLTNQTTIIREKKREASRKPDAFYALVDELCPGSKLEMFARENRKGWTAWGAETGKFS